MTSIEWTDVTWNPVRGCSRVSEGCRNCYAEKIAGRFSGPGQQFEGFAKMTGDGARWIAGTLNGGGARVELIQSKLDEPLHWRSPRRVFVNSMSDLFHESLPDEAIDEVFARMALAPQHTFQILTKRPERMLRYITSAGNLDGVASRVASLAQQAWGRRETPAAIHVYPLGPILADNRPEFGYRWFTPWPLPNVWLGVSVEDQATADERIPLLLQTPAAKRFVSYEPALGLVDFRSYFRPYKEWPDPKLDWIIVGGESGPGARPFDVAWARSTIEQCKAAGVAVFVKQMGRWVKGDHAGFGIDRWLCQDGRVWVPPIFGAHAKDRPADAVAFQLMDMKGGNTSEWPEDLRVREFPA